MQYERDFYKNQLKTNLMCAGTEFLRGQVNKLKREKRELEVRLGEEMRKRGGIEEENSEEVVLSSLEVSESDSKSVAEFSHIDSLLRNPIRKTFSPSKLSPLKRITKEFFLYTQQESP